MPAAKTVYIADLSTGGQIHVTIAAEAGNHDFKCDARLQGIVSRWALELEYPKLSRSLHSSLQAEIDRHFNFYVEVINIKIPNHVGRPKTPEEKVTNYLHKQVGRARAAMVQPLNFELPDVMLDDKTSFKDGVQRFRKRTARKYLNPDKASDPLTSVRRKPISAEMRYPALFASV